MVAGAAIVGTVGRGRRAIGIGRRSSGAVTVTAVGGIGRVVTAVRNAALVDGLAVERTVAAAVVPRSRVGVVATAGTAVSAVGGTVTVAVTGSSVMAVVGTGAGTATAGAGAVTGTGGVGTTGSRIGSRSGSCPSPRMSPVRRSTRPSSRS